MSIYPPFYHGWHWVMNVNCRVKKAFLFLPKCAYILGILFMIWYCWIKQYLLALAALLLTLLSLLLYFRKRGETFDGTALIFCRSSPQKIIARIYSLNYSKLSLFIQLLKTKLPCDTIISLCKSWFQILKKKLVI